MRKFISDFVGFAIFTAIYNFVLKKAFLPLGENAVISYIDDKIGQLLGLTAEKVDSFVLEWAVPAALALITVCLWHMLFVRRPADKTKKEKGLSNGAMVAHAVALPPAQYSKAQINRILEAIDAFYTPLGEIEQILKSGTWIAGSLEAIIRDKGAAALLVQMDGLRLKLLGPSDRLDEELRKFSLYREVCNILSEKGSQHDAFFAAYNELANVLREIPDKLSAPALAIFVEAKKATFIARTAHYLVWAQQKKKALAEYREWYLRQPTTD